MNEFSKTGRIDYNGERTVRTELPAEKPEDSAHENAQNRRQKIRVVGQTVPHRVRQRQPEEKVAENTTMLVVFGAHFLPEQDAEEKRQEGRLRLEEMPLPANGESIVSPSARR